LENLINWIQEVTGLNPELQGQILFTFLIILAVWLIRTIIIRIIWRQTEDAHIRYRWQKSTIYIAFVISSFIVIKEWFSGFQSMATFLGLVTAGLAIALQDLVKSLAGWAFILWRKPFQVGDRIQVGENSGDVIDIRIFKFSLVEIGNWVDADQSTGRVIHLPNSLILTETIANYTQGFEYIWNEIPVLVTFESDWQKSKQILMQISEKYGAHLSKAAEKRIKEASKRYMIFYTTLTPIVYTSVKDCGVMLTLRYLIDPRKRRGSEQEIWEEILIEFAKHENIDFAYPTQRFYNNALEGKEGTKPK
jgi:small-conductance mechanosensitive channel